MLKNLLKFLILTFAIVMIGNGYTLANETYEFDQIITESEILEVINNNSGNVKIKAKAAICYDYTYNKTLYEKNADFKMPNASTTKILTAIVAYENSNMDDVVEVSLNAASVGGSSINLKKGNKIKMGDLMKGLLMSSGNDAATAIAEHVGGSVDGFCTMMNEKAVELGATNTNFVTPHGLDRDNHYTTVNDLLIFTKYFMKIPYLMEIVNCKNATIKIGDYFKDIRSTNEMLSIYDEVNGIKTGFTGKAGRCLVTSIVSGDRNIVTIVLGCDTRKDRTLDTIQLIDYGYRNFEPIDVFEKLQKKFEIRIKKAKNSRYELNIKGKEMILVAKKSKDMIDYEYKLKKDLVAPIYRGDEIGKIDVKLDGEKIAQISLVMPFDIEKKNILQFMEEILNNQVGYIEIKT